MMNFLEEIILYKCENSEQFNSVNNSPQVDIEVIIDIQIYMA
jgi:hypothetical protein